MQITTSKPTLNFTQFHEQQLRNLFHLKEDLTKTIFMDWESRANQVVITAAEQEVINKLYPIQKLK